MIWNETQSYLAKSCKVPLLCVCSLYPYWYVPGLSRKMGKIWTNASEIRWGCKSKEVEHPDATVRVGAAGSWLYLASYVLVHASKHHHFSSPSRCIQNIEISHIRILLNKEMDRADIDLIICNFPDNFPPKPLLQTVQFLFWMDLSGTLADFLRAWARKTSGISSKWMMDGSYRVFSYHNAKKMRSFSWCKLCTDTTIGNHTWKYIENVWKKKQVWNRKARCYTDWPTA